MAESDVQSPNTVNCLPAAAKMRWISSSLPVPSLSHMIFINITYIKEIMKIMISNELIHVKLNLKISNPYTRKVYELSVHLYTTYHYLFSDFHNMI